MSNTNGQLLSSEYNITNQTFINLVETSYNASDGVYKTVSTSEGKGDLVVLTTRVLAEMLGYFFAPSVNIPSTLPYSQNESLDSIQNERIFNFFNFWNQSNASDFFANLGADFLLVSGIRAESNPIYSTIMQYCNIFVTYVVVLGLSIPTSPNGIGLSSPLDIFTPKSNTAKYNNAGENLMTFLSNCAGLGNVPVYTNTNVGTGTTPSTIWNKGYVDIFCTQVFADYCEEQVPSLETTSQACINGYRTKLANSTTALNWCGCFAPLSNFFDSALQGVKNKQACDSFCYRDGGIKLYNPPSGSETGGSDRDIKCSNSQVCIIDNNNINASDSQGSITFNQICKCSNKQACLCYIDTSTPGLLDNVSSDDEGLNSSVIFNQECSNAICFTINPVSGVENEVDCNSVNPGRTGDVFTKSSSGMTTLENYERIDSTFWFFILFFLIVLLIYQFSYLEIKLF